MPLSTIYTSSSIGSLRSHLDNNDVGSSRSFYETNNGPNPSHPAYIFGKRVVRPLIDLGFAAGDYLWKTLTAKFTSMDGTLSKMCNIFPGAQASSIPDTRCELPEGSYQESCHNTTITYTPENSCLLQTYCNTIIPSIHPQYNQLNYAPSRSLILGNENGTLTISEDCISFERVDPINDPAKYREHLKIANNQLDRLFNHIEVIDKQLSDPTIDFEQSDKLKLKKETLLKKQNEILTGLRRGDVITFGENGQLMIVTDFESEKPTQQAFRRLAQSTGGIMGLSPESKDLTPLINKMLEHIQENTEPNQPIDVAFVLDTTSSMSNDIADVKKNLSMFLERAQVLGDKNGNALRFAILEYRDQGDLYLHRVNTDFTRDIDKLVANLEIVEVAGGGDSPEAVLDALLAAKEYLSWNKEAKHSIILIGDAPPHPKTVDGLHDEQTVASQCQAMGANIFVYPILT
jgi:hypothetical protein